MPKQGTDKNKGLAKTRDRQKQETGKKAKTRVSRLEKKQGEDWQKQREVEERLEKRKGGSQGKNYEKTKEEKLVKKPGKKPSGKHSKGTVNCN